MEDKTFICFLRGINVSGKNMIKMKDLSALFQKLDFKNISTYLQSGNVIFLTDNDLSKEKISDRIRNGIADGFGMDVPVMIRSNTELADIFRRNPFINEENIDADKLHVTMLDSVPEKQKREVMLKNDFTPERFVISGEEIFLYCPEGYGRARLNNNFLEKKLGVKATTRNWRTITSLNEMANRLL